MKRQTFETFMSAVGVEPGEYEHAFEAARRDGHPDFDDYLQTATMPDAAAMYRVDHLTAFWNSQCQQSLAEHFARWLTETDSFGDPSKKWDVLRRRFDYPAELAALAERSSRAPGRTGTVDVRFDNALQALRNVNAHEAGDYAAAIAKTLYTTASIRVHTRQG
ncbi:hypothetical protein [Amycolatopsis thailandensis]|uniref:hypothetical protein n=1 Tax=Amycolatopsis thailandensis TaxID=589330 RepID=UPI003636C4DE